MEDHQKNISNLKESISETLQQSDIDNSQSIKKKPDSIKPKISPATSKAKGSPRKGSKSHLFQKGHKGFGPHKTTGNDDEDFRKMVIGIAKSMGKPYLRNLAKSDPDIFARLVTMAYRGEDPSSRDDKEFIINLGGIPLSQAEKEKHAGNQNKDG